MSELRLPAITPLALQGGNRSSDGRVRVGLLRRRADAPIADARSSEHLFPRERKPRALLEAVSLEFELTPEEWVAAQGAHQDLVHMRRGDVQRLQTIAGTALGVISVAGLFMGLWLTSVIWAAIGFVYLRGIPRQVRKQTRLQLSRTAREGVVQGLFGRHRIELREEGLVDITDGYETVVRWGTIEGVEHTGGLFMIYTGPNSFVPIPDSAFRDSAELRAFSDAFHTLRGLHAEGALDPAGRDSIEAPEATGVLVTHP